jgi:DNA recombination protein RmuC
LAIEQRSSEVWQTLSAVKTEFSKFGGVLEKVKSKLQSATNEIDQVGTRTRAMQRQLRNVESAPEDTTTALFAKESDFLPSSDAISDN